MNLGSGMEISIRDLVNLIAQVTGFEGEIVWDTNKPDGGVPGGLLRPGEGGARGGETAHPRQVAALSRGDQPPGGGEHCRSALRPHGTGSPEPSPEPAGDGGWFREQGEKEQRTMGSGGSSLVVWFP